MSSSLVTNILLARPPRTMLHYAQLDNWGMRMKRSSTKDLLLSAGLAILMLLVIMAATVWLIQRIAGG